eukprot:7603986-Pyramimonas_sp.AAC.1
MSRAKAGFSIPRRSRHGVFHRPVHVQIVGMFQSVCLLRCSDSAFIADCEDALIEALVSALPTGYRQR